MADVKSLSSSVVREYLSRKGLKETLAMLDKEMPRTKDCISNRAQLAKELHINTLMKKNKERQDSFRTMLEVIVEFMMNKSSSKHSGQVSTEFERKLKAPSARNDNRKGKSGNIAESVDEKNKRSETRPSSKHEVSSPVSSTDDELKSHTHDTRTNEVSELDFKSNINPSKNPFTKDETLRTCEKQLKQDVVRKPTSFNEPSSLKSSSIKKGSRRMMGSLAGSVTSTGLHNSGKKEMKGCGKDGLREKTRYFQDDWNGSSDFHGRKTLENVPNEQPMPWNQEVILRENARTKSVKDDLREKPKPDWKKEILQKKDVRKNLSSSQLATNEELIFEDIDETVDDDLQKMNFNPRKSSIPLIPCEAVTLKQAKDLKAIVFGSSVGSFNSEWRHQGFTFSSFPDLKYGMIQHKGGPCGLLASVQAVVLKHLLFNDRSSGNTQHFHFSSQETSDALCSALTEILWRAGSQKTARVAVCSQKEHFMSGGGYKADRLTEKIVIYETSNCSDLGRLVKENINQFSCDNGGCILLLYSAILSRTVEKIKEDMDDENGTLMGAHGYCTQDMVNLLLTGKAISNTFDDVIELDSGGETKNILKGVDQQSDIGFLSLFEHYKSVLVGVNLKNPKFPIWVVCSESHFSVLFSIKRSLVNERRSQKKFDLYYYDGLAAQNEEIRLTVDVSGGAVLPDTSDDLVPPLEHCIRTKWKDAVIDWNGTEPLL